MTDKAPNIRILTLRDQKVVLDADLAAVYGVTTKRLNEQFRRNRKRFPKDFVSSRSGRISLRDFAQRQAALKRLVPKKK
jgi:hypothetical protein